MKRGHVGTVCGEEANDLRYWRTALRTWELAQPHIEDMLRIVSPENGKCFPSVLDLGCGSGRFIPFLLSVANNYVGVDHAELALKIAGGRFGCPNIRFHQAMLTNLPHQVGRASLIWSCTTLQHVVEPEDFELAITQLSQHAAKDSFLLLHENSTDTQMRRSHCRPRSPRVYLDELEKHGWEYLASGPGIRDDNDTHTILTAIMR